MARAAAEHAAQQIPQGHAVLATGVAAAPFLRELVEAAGLCVPFDENALKDVAESATAYLDAFDPARLG